MLRRALGAVSLLGLLLAIPAPAVAQSTANGFIVTHEMTIAATLTFTLAAVGETTRVRLRYVVGGLTQMQAPVSAVLLDQVQRLKASLGTGGPATAAIPGGAFLMGTAVGFGCAYPSAG